MGAIWSPASAVVALVPLPTAEPVSPAAAAAAGVVDINVPDLTVPVLLVVLFLLLRK